MPKMLYEAAKEEFIPYWPNIRRNLLYNAVILAVLILFLWLTRSA